MSLCVFISLPPPPRSFHLCSFSSEKNIQTLAGQKQINFCHKIFLRGIRGLLRDQNILSGADTFEDEYLLLTGEILDVFSGKKNMKENRFFSPLYRGGKLTQRTTGHTQSKTGLSRYGNRPGGLIFDPMVFTSVLFSDYTDNVSHRNHI